MLREGRQVAQPAPRLPSRLPSQSGGSVQVPSSYGNLHEYEAMGAMSIGEPALAQHA
ncbi:MAG: hypothetical protein ABSC61_03035 [Anaerolineales bacterium]